MNDSQRHGVNAALHCPPYLFRAASDRSHGGIAGNSDCAIDPLAQHGEDYLEYFTDLDWQDATLMVETHLTWKKSIASHLISFSSSLHWVLVHAAKLRFEGESNVRIVVLSTAKIRDMARVFRAKDLIQCFGLHNCRADHQNVEVYAQAEYLVYGKLSQNDGFATARFDSLIDAGLYVRFKDLNVPALITECEDEMDSLDRSLRQAYSHKIRLDSRRISLNPEERVEYIRRQKRWDRLSKKLPSFRCLHQRIAKLRHKWWFQEKTENKSKADWVKIKRQRRERRAHPAWKWKEFFDGREYWKLPDYHLQQLRRLAQCFGADWECLMTFAFVNLRRRDLASTDIQKVLSDLDGLPMLRLPTCDDDADVRDNLEERIQLLKMIRTHQQRCDEQATSSALNTVSPAENRDDDQGAAEERAVVSPRSNANIGSEKLTTMSVSRCELSLSAAVKRSPDGFELPVMKLVKRMC
ncbi:hypothetical protein LTR17_023362 [Elasticomyces elasticus]|nr:hypothetical protein LTR17_023362 [Elasticomyces elasticus]